MIEICAAYLVLLLGYGLASTLIDYRQGRLKL